MLFLKITNKNIDFVWAYSRKLHESQYSTFQLLGSASFENRRHHPEKIRNATIGIGQSQTTLKGVYQESREFSCFSSLCKLIVGDRTRIDSLFIVGAHYKLWLIYLLPHF